MTTLLEGLRNRIAVVRDPYARRLRGAPLREWAEGRATPVLLAALRADEETREENRRRDDEARRNQHARKAEEARKAFDEGRQVMDAEPLEREPEWRSVLDHLDAQAASFGLQHRGQIGEHLQSRRADLVPILHARYATEGEPSELVELRADLARLVEESWELSQQLKSMRERYVGLGGSRGATEALEQEILALDATVRAKGTSADLLRKRMILEFGVER